MSYEKRLTNYKVQVRSNDFYLILFLQFDHLIFFLNFGPQGSEFGKYFAGCLSFANITGELRVASLRLTGVPVLCP